MPQFGTNQLTRMITNLYTAVFEQQTGSLQNAIFRRALQRSKTIMSHTAQDYLVEMLRDEPWALYSLTDAALELYMMIYRLNRPAVSNASIGGTSGRVANNAGAYFNFSNFTPTLAQVTAVLAQPSLIASDALGYSFLADTSIGQEIIDGSVTFYRTYPYAFETLFKTSVQTVATRTLMAYHGNTSSEVRVDISSTGRLQVVIDSGGTPTVVTYGTSPIIWDGNLHHIVWLPVSLSTTCILIIDGTAYSSTSFSGSDSLSLAGTRSWSFGGSQISGGAFRGYLQGMAVYDHYVPLTRWQAHNAAINARAATPAVNNNVDLLHAPRPRYYADLSVASLHTTSSQWWSSQPISTPTTVQYTNAVINATQMWAVFKLDPDILNGVANNGVLFEWSTDANNLLSVLADGTAANIICRRKSASVGSDASQALTTAKVTICARWSSTQVGISVDGAAFTNVANSSIPTPSNAQFKLGYGAAYSNSYLAWVAMGVGTITDADAAAFHALDVLDPQWEDFPRDTFTALDPSFLWACKDATHTPTAAWGEEVYT